MLGLVVRRGGRLGRCHMFLIRWGNCVYRYFDFVYRLGFCTYLAQTYNRTG